MADKKQAPAWYRGASSDWEAPDDPMSAKAAVQDLIRSTVGGGGAAQQHVPTMDWGDFVKSLATDAASQAPLAAIAPGGVGKTLVRGAASLAAGTGMDQLLHPDKPLFDSGIDAGVNTTVGMGLPHLLANETRYTPPDIAGTGTSAPFLKIWNLLNPGNYGSTPRTVTRNTTNGPRQVPRNIGDSISEALFTGTNGKVDLSPQAVLNMFGFGANAALDSTVNKPTK